jgi:hypothetical protein
MEQPGFRTGLARRWPWIVLALATLPAMWHVTVFPNDLDEEYPAVARPTFSRRPPPAYRLAEPGDTIDRVVLYCAAGAVVVASVGWFRGHRAGTNLWPAAFALALGGYWYAANPGPGFDGWHGWGWRSIFDPTAPSAQRAALAAIALVLSTVVVANVLHARSHWRALYETAGRRGARGLWVVAGALIVLRQFEIPGVEPAGYWPRWAMVGGMLAFDLALLRALPPPPARWRRIGLGLAGVVLWYALDSIGIRVAWYYRPIDRLRPAVDGRIFISAMPTYRGLQVAHARHHFKTIINLFPEDSPLRSPRLREELQFVREHGIQYIEGTSVLSESDAFLDSTLALAQDPSAWPILVHCHGCMDRTPAWVGIYRFLIEGVPLDEIIRFIEQHRGYRPKASVTLLYNRVLAARAPARYAADPTAQVLERCAQGTVDPYYEQLREEQARANPRAAERVSQRAAPVRRP